MLSNNNQKGDTIIEVLIALAVLALAFVISYSTANRALLDGQNSQEHSTALELLDAQAEALQYEASQPNDSINANEFNKPSSPSDFCLQPSSGRIKLYGYFQASINQPNNYPTQCRLFGNADFNYYIAIEPSTSISDDFHIVIWWQGIGNMGIQQEEISYKVYDD